MLSNQMNEIRLSYLLGVLLLSFADNVFAQCVINKRVNGVSLVSEHFLLDSIHIPPIVQVKANYAAVVPYFFRSQKDSGMYVMELIISGKDKG